MPPHYELSGLHIESTQELETLSPCGEPPRELPRLRFELAVGSRHKPERWIHQRTAPGCTAPWVSVARIGANTLLRYHGLADFLLASKCTTISCWLEPSCNAATMEHLLADHVIPQLWHLRGQPSFHGSAVALTEAGDVAAFLGDSGAGKSTLAASLAEPFGLVSDDCLVLRVEPSSVRAFPSYPASRLNDDSAVALRAAPSPPLWARLDPVASTAATGSKARHAQRSPSAHLSLRALYVVTAGAELPMIVPVTRRDAVVELARHLHRLDPNDRVRLANELDLLVQLVCRVHVAKLLLPHRFDALAEVQRAVRADFEATVAASAVL